MGLQPLQLVPGQRYTWRLEIGEEGRVVDVSESFMVREAQHAPGSGTARQP